MDDYVIQEFGPLGLGYKTIITNVRHGKDDMPDFEYRRGKMEDGLEIYLWDDTHEHRWTVASFEYDKDNAFWELHEIGNRLCDERINWKDFERLYVYARLLMANSEEDD